MTTCVLDLNDAAIRYMDSGGQVVDWGPGMAVWPNGSEGWRHGAAAFQVAQQQPQRVVLGFWRKLGQPGAADGGQGPAPADLVHRQLAAILSDAGKPHQVLLVVPGDFGARSLALLAGIFKALETAVCGFVDEGLIRLSTLESSAPICGKSLDYFSLQLTCSHLTACDWVAPPRPPGSAVPVGKPTLVRGGVTAVSHLGLDQIYKTAARYLAQAMVDQARFDPLHFARTQQALHNGIADLFVTLGHQDQALLELEHKGQAYEAKIDRADVARALQPLLNPLAELVSRRGSHGIYLCPLSAAVPGLRETLEAVSQYPVTSVDANAYLRTAQKLQIQAVSGGEIARILRMQAHWLQPDLLSAPSEPVATHVLHGHRAWRLSEAPFHLGESLPADQTGVALPGLTPAALFMRAGQTFLQPEKQPFLRNGEPVQQLVRVKPGDRLGPTDCRLKLIAEVG